MQVSVGGIAAMAAVSTLVCAVTAVDAEVARVKFVAIGDGLHRLVTDLGLPGMEKPRGQTDGRRGRQHRSHQPDSQNPVRGLRENGLHRVSINRNT
jgi:hypothetical protein